MRYLRMLGMAAVAAVALMAFVGASTAAAETTICKTESLSECYGVGTKLKISSIGTTDTKEPAGNKHIVMTGFGGFSTTECNATLEGQIETATTPSGKFVETWSNCTNGGSAETVTNGTVGIHHDAEHNGSVTIKGFVFKFVNGITCYLGGEIQGTLTHSTATTGAVIHVTQSVEKINTPAEPSSAFCPSTVVWHATFEVSEPNPLFVNTGV